jgi:hypothetical protein
MSIAIPAAAAMATSGSAYHQMRRARRFLSGGLPALPVDLYCASRKPFVRCELSQKGMCLDWPHRQSATRVSSRSTVPSLPSILTGPRT